MNNIEKSSANTVGIFAEDFTQRFTDRTFRIFTDADHLANLAKKWRNVAPDKAQGHMFEQLETIKFNYDALKKDSELYAKTTASLGLPTDPVDIIISNGKKTLREVQAKSCNNAARSAFALSQKKYDEMLRLSPSDQHQKIEELLKKRIASGTLKAEDYEQTLRNLKKTLEYDNIASGGTHYQEALDATNQDVADQIADTFKLKSAITDIHESGKRAGNIGAAVAGGSGLISEGYAVWNGERELGEAMVNITLNSAKGYATGYMVTALSKGITHTTSYFLGETLAKSLTRTNAPATIAAGVISSSKSMVCYLNGDISLEELTEEISHTAITSTASFYYGALGQAVIPIPVVGALVGASVGYFIGNMLHQSGLVALGDSAIVKAAKERREAIQSMCLAAIPQIKKDRLALEEQLTRHFSDRKDIFNNTFQEMDNALLEWNPDRYVSALRVINDKFGTILPFKNFTEFDSLMRSDKAFNF